MSFPKFPIGYRNFVYYLKCGCRAWGFILDNKKLYAGNGSDTMSEVTKKKMSDWQKGKPKGTCWNKGKFGYLIHTEETKHKISCASKNLVRTDIHNERISKSKKFNFEKKKLDVIIYEHSDVVKEKIAVHSRGSNNPRSKKLLFLNSEGKEFFVHGEMKKFCLE